MQRIDTSTKAVDLFGAGKHGFKDGNKALGIAATQLNAALFNNVQEEIARVVEAAGITLNGAVYEQLLSALTNGWNLPKSLLSSGYITLPGGIIIQWIPVTMPASLGASTNFTWPIAFPNAIYAVAMAPNYTMSASGNITMAVTNRTPTGATLLNLTFSGTIGALSPTTIIAIGK